MTTKIQDVNRYGSLVAIRANARPRTVNIAYVVNPDPAAFDAAHPLGFSTSVPPNHAPGPVPPARPLGRAYTREAYTLTDAGSPSSSLIPPSGLPPAAAAQEVRMVVMKQQMCKRWWKAGHEDQLWGAVIFCRPIDHTYLDGDHKERGVLKDHEDARVQQYGWTIAHEVAHVLGLMHRLPYAEEDQAEHTDGLDLPDCNLMHPLGSRDGNLDLDILQARALRFSEALQRFPR